MVEKKENCRVERARGDARKGELEVTWIMGDVEYWFCCTKVGSKLWEYDLGERKEGSKVPYLLIQLDWFKISRGIEQAFNQGYLSQSQIIKSGCYYHLTFSKAV